jgi:putative intracellular protease/amidase
MELSGRKVIIPVEEMFNTHEFWYPYYRLKEAGCEVVVMGSGSAEKYKLRLRWTLTRTRYRPSITTASLFRVDMHRI